MFFDISRKPNPILPNTDQFGNWYLSHDAGWKATTEGTGGTKGYRTSDGKGGNWVQINFNYLENEVTIETPEHRTFPLWYNDNQISNFIQLENKAHNFNQVTHNGTNVELKWNYPDWVKALETSQSKLLNKTQVCDQIIEHLVAEITEVKNSTDLPFFVSNSKGMDSTVNRAVMDYMGIDYTLCDKKRPAGDDKVNKFSKYIWEQAHMDRTGSNEFGNNFWGYNQLNLENKPHVQVTGFWGDEYLQRSPLFTQWYLNEYNIDVLDIFNYYDCKYAYGHYARSFKESLIKKGKVKNSRQRLINHMTNDFQMWHINRCITLTPFCSRRILEISLNMDPMVVVSQLRDDCEVHRTIIKQLNPKLLEILDTHKEMDLSALSKKEMETLGPEKLEEKSVSGN